MDITTNCIFTIIYIELNLQNHKLVCSIRGPGNMLLSLEVVNNKVCMLKFILII